MLAIFDLRNSRWAYAKYPRNFSLTHFSLIDQIAYLAYLIIGEFGSGMIFAFWLRTKSHFDRMEGIFRRCAILKIFDTIVGFVAVYMIDHHALRTRANKCSCNELSNRYCFSITIPKKAHGKVSRLPKFRMEKFSNGCTVPFLYIANASLLGNLVPTLITDNTPPYVKIDRFLDILNIRHGITTPVFRSPICLNRSGDFVFTDNYTMRKE